MKVSIITINLNNFDGLEKTIRSVISQNTNQFEFIIIDGNSKDGSKDLLTKYGNRIDFSISERDSGIYNAMNKGIRKATGEYCLFLNSGDILFNDHVLSDILDQDLVSEIVNGNAYVDEKGKGRKLVKAPKKISFYTFYNHTILHQASLIKTTLFQTIGFYNEDLKIVADWEFFLRVLFVHQYQYQSINLTISIFDSSGISSLPESSQICLRERKEVMRKFFPYFLEDYQLLEPRSTFIFLHNVQKSQVIRLPFLFLSRIMNKLFKSQV